MKTATRLIASVAASTALFATAAVAQTVREGGQKFAMTLTAAAEVPGPGDANARGTADITINPGQERICWEVTTSGVNPGYSPVATTGSHIHRGAAGATGPILVTMGVTLNGTHTGCVNATRALIDEIRKSPANFYVNLHWADITEPITLPSFAAGALRAQLGKAPLKSN